MHIINPYRFAGAPAATLLVEDTFTDTNGTGIASHTPDTDTPGNGWVEYTGQTLEIQSNKVEAIGSIHNAFIDLNATATYAEAEFGSIPDSASVWGIWLRSYLASGSEPQSGTYYGYRVCIENANSSNPNLIIQRWNGSTSTLATTALTGEGPLTGETWTLKVWSDSDKVYGEITLNGTDYNVEYSTTEYNDKTYVGLRLIGANTLTADDFKAYDSKP